MSLPPKSKIKNALKSAARLPVTRRRDNRTASASSDSPPRAPATVKTAAVVRSQSMSRGRRIRIRGLRVGRLSLGNGKGSGRNTLSPAEGENPLVLLRVQVVSCTDLLAKDRNGFSDPFASISLPPHPTRHSTPVSKRTLNPSFPPAQSTFDFPIFLSLADRLGVLEVVLWDKDYFGVGEKIGMGRKEYLGEVGISLEDWFHIRENGEQRALSWDAEGNTPFALPLVSARSNTHARGTVTLKIGFVEAPKHQSLVANAKDALGAAREGLGAQGLLGKDNLDANHHHDTEISAEFEEVYKELLRRSRPSLVNVPPTEGVGTVRSKATSRYSAAQHKNGTSTSHLQIHNEPNTSHFDELNDNIYLNSEYYQEGYPYADDGGLSSEDEGDEMVDEEGMQLAQAAVDGQDESEVEESGSDVSSIYSGSEVSDDDSRSDASPQDSESSEDERGDDIRTPTNSPLISLEPSPMTTPIASNSNAHHLPNSFASLYENPPASAPPIPSSMTVESLLESELPYNPSQTLRSSHDSTRKPQPPTLNLTPASPTDTMVPLLSSAKPESRTPAGSATDSAHPASSPPTPVVTSSPRSGRFRLSPTRAATFAGISGVKVSDSVPFSPSRFASIPAPPKSPRLSGMLHQIPRIPKPKFPTRRSSSGTTNPPTTLNSSGSYGIYDLTEDVPRLPMSLARPSIVDSLNGNTTDPGEEKSEKKSRFRKSWSGVRVRPRRASSADSPHTNLPLPSVSGNADNTLGLADGATNLGGASRDLKGQGQRIKSKTGKTVGKNEKKEKKEKKRTKGKKGKSTAEIPTRPATRGGRRSRPSYSFGGDNSNDIVGIVMLEIEKAEDLPKLKNMTRTGWDMDPFVVISFGKKVFRTRVIRHSLNPSWDEKLLFHVRRYETNFKVQLTVLDWDKLSSNDYIGECDFSVNELIAAFEDGRGVDPETGLYPLDDKGNATSGMKEFRLPLKTAREMPWEAKHHPFVTFRGKYQPYAALRQRFWLQYLKQYDTDDTGMISHLELTSMLDSLGSTLSNTTTNSFFTRFNKDPRQEELTMAEAIQCLETELGRPEREKKRLGSDDAGYESSVSATPVLMLADKRGMELSLDQLDFSGPPLSAMINPEIQDAEFHEPDRVPAPKVHTKNDTVQQPLDSVATPSSEYDQYNSGSSGIGSYSSSDADVDERLMDYPSNDNGQSKLAVPSVSTPTSSTTARVTLQTQSPSVTFVLAPPPPSRSAPVISLSNSYSSTRSSIPPTPSEATTPITDSPVERVINVQTCPLCHRPRLNSKAEVDIVTHLAICASQDWKKVDRIMVGNFVTASQAQRKWYTKVIAKVSSGNYKLGANSANIIVQNRLTGQLEEEKMQVYVRLGIRLLYKGMKSRMEGSRARRLLKSLSIKQGVKYDSLESARDIPAFIEFHKLDMREVRDPLESFKTFNQFFYRKLKPEARPVESPSDSYRLVSAADCRCLTFESVSEATRLWIKGREFSVSRLLGEVYKAEAERYNGGALAIFRLAPQDYHRFHSPVDGKIGKMTYISGEYYTVNPQAIRTALDVYGDNARKIVPIDSPQFGRVMAVCVGAMMVGTILTTVEEGQWVKRGEEFGYFAFGGSTIVLLFEPGVLEWDEDLVINGRAALETLVRVGMGLGTGLRKGQTPVA
ncbi:phosphatidylserine decarboxylase-domain-containing protein [Rhodocollybia butyracea]|uniref:Phosphatidylserine decarboxylase proenzyme 2 n=1 Tax=Rhodocollybia butyracea TaxID=206335 RepID=A0A9P5Q0S0_9AGAR|nr:phosphatidylserine decarboxylase-domain-containing protein [Rhodocollybia butyracea]